MHPDDRGVVKRGLGIIIAVALVLGLKFYTNANRGVAVQERVKEIIATLPNYADERSYIDELFQKAHERAYEAAHSLASEKEAASFDSEKYLNLVFTTMVEDAQLEGRGELANAIQARQSLMLGLRSSLSEG